MALTLNTEFSSFALGAFDPATQLGQYWAEHAQPAGYDGFYIREDDIGRHLRVSVAGSGDTSTYRAEVTGANAATGPTWQIGNGTTFAIGVRCRAAAVAQSGSSGEMSILQIHQAQLNSLSPPFMIGVKNGAWNVLINYSRVNGVSSNTDLLARRYSLGGVVVGAVEEFVVEYTVAKTGTGTIKVYRNGTLVVNQTDVPTAYDIAGDCYLKWGIYSFGWSGGAGGPIGYKQAVDFYSYRIGASYADVALENYPARIRLS